MPNPPTLRNNVQSQEWLCEQRPQRANKGGSDAETLNIFAQLENIGESVDLRYRQEGRGEPQTAGKKAEGMVRVDGLVKAFYSVRRETWVKVESRLNASLPLGRAAY